MRLSAESIFGAPGRPLRVREANDRQPTGPISAEAIKVMFTMSGWADVAAPDHRVTVSEGTVLTIPACLECAGFPHGWAHTITFYLHTDYIAEHVRWMRDVHPMMHQLRRALSVDAGLQQTQVPPTAMRALAVPLLRLARLPHLPEHDLARLGVALEALDTVGWLAGAPRKASYPFPSVVVPREQVLAAMSLMREHLACAWNMHELARSVALSPSQLGRLFRAQVGIPPAAYLTRVRVERMAELLATTHQSITDIARATGWTSPAVAARAFKRRYGVNPRDYASFVRARPMRDLRQLLQKQQSA